MGWCTDQVDRMDKIVGKLVDFIEHEMEKPEEEIDTVELGRVTDMVKDLNHAQKDCYMSWYYCCMAKKCGDDGHTDAPVMTCLDHYNGYKNSQDMTEKKMHIDGYVAISAKAMKEMFQASDSDTKRKMKTDLTKLIGEMTI